ncbi:hypothetical protein [Methanohalophilus sp.]|uniref:DUF7289 family protein n=1 Tax=Methanohalophilus sp. TaxID=1966352 RepID=UPI002630C881|nr:hypothetical protein [Methanohalophilus sp.]MDK2892702.1 hypothetical protein [Methanohalophilus sp.]
MNTLQNLVLSKKAVSSVVGVLLIFSLTIVSMSIILLFGVPAINDMQDNAQAQKVEEEFTILDSRTSKVALGESPLQTIAITMIGGGVYANDADDPNSSSITIRISNTTNSSLTEELTVSLGTLEYIKDNSYIAYEGGGVWSKHERYGGSVMISPPEFHYNGETLTLPIMSIKGNSSTSGSGDVRIAIRSDSKPDLLYPNTSVSSLRTNPITSNKVVVIIKSDYYDAWAKYAATMTQTNVKVDDTNNTATVELYTSPPMGEMPLINEIKIAPLNPANPDPFQDFVFYFEAEDNNANGLNPDNYVITATSGSRTLTYKLQKKSDLHLDVIYEDTDISSDAEEWESVDDYHIYGTQEDQYSTVDLTNDTFMMRYTKKAADPDFSWPNDIIEKYNESFSIKDLTQHYIKLMTEEGSINFIIDGGPQDPIDYSTSTVTLNYDIAPGFITYLHITQNDLYVDILN